MTTSNSKTVSTRDVSTVGPSRPKGLVKDRLGPSKSISDKLGPYSRSTGLVNPNATIVRREGCDEREILLEKRLQRNRNTAKAPRLQQEKLDAELALLLERKGDGASSYTWRREHSPGNKSRTSHPEDTRRIVGRHRNRLLERSRHRSRSTERSRHRSRSMERNRSRGRSQERSRLEGRSVESSSEGNSRSERRIREASPDERNRGSRKTPSRRSKTEELA